MKLIRESINSVLLLGFFLIPLIVWPNHFHLFEAMKVFVFLTVILLCGGVLLSSMLLYQKWLIPYRRLGCLVLGYWVYQVINWWIFPYTDTKYLVLLSGLIALFFIISAVTTPTHRNRLLHVIILAALISSIHGCLQYFGVGPFSRFGDYFGSKTGGGVRIFTTFGHPNLLGGFYVFVLPLLLAFFLHSFQAKARLRCIYFGFVFVGAVVALFMAQARGAWLSAALTLGLFTMIYGKNALRSRLAKHPLRSGLLACSAVAVLASGAWVLSTHTSLLDSTSLRIRALYYTTTLQMIRERPLFGRGIGTFSMYYPLYQDERIAARYGSPALDYRVEHPHNEHLEILHDSGLLGYGLFLWIIIEAARRLLRRKQVIETGLSLAVIGLLLDGLLSQNLRYVVIASLLWLAIGCANLRETPQPIAVPFPATLPLWRLAGSGLVVLALVFPLRFAYRTMHADYYVKAGKRLLAVPLPHVAVTWFHEARARDPQNPAILYDLASCYEQMHQPQQAIAVYQQLHEIHPTFRDLNFRLAQLYWQQGERATAKSYYEQQIAVNTIHWQSYARLVELASHAGNPAQGRRYLKHILAIRKVTNQEIEDAKIAHLKTLFQKQ